MKGHTLFKSILAAGIATTIATQANAIPVEQCVSIGHFVEVMAEGRDAGISATDMYYILEDQSLPDAITTKLLNLVYIIGSDIDSKSLNHVFVGTCVGESL